MTRDDPGWPDAAEGDLDCTIFVSVDTRMDVLERLCARTPCATVRTPCATSEEKTLRLPSLTADFVDNGYADTCRDDDNFLSWPSILDCEPVGTPSRSAVIRDVTHLLDSLWSMNIRAVAACNYEHELPFSGGSTRF